MAITEYEQFDLEQLNNLSSHREFQGLFGPVKIQRHLIYGYNRAVRLIDLGVEKGLLVRDSKAAYQARFKR